jgi:hypothetical protein
MSEWTGTQGEAYDKIDRYLRKNLWCDDYAEFSCALKILWDTPPDDVAELVEALRDVIDAADGDGWKQLDPSLRKQRAALAKWEGK